MFFSQEEGVDFKYNKSFVPSNVMDKWIISFTQSLMLFIEEEMKSNPSIPILITHHYSGIHLFLIVYRLYTVVPRLVRFIDQLTNWYVRFNRKRIKVS